MGQDGSCVSFVGDGSGSLMGHRLVKGVGVAVDARALGEK